MAILSTLQTRLPGLTIGLALLSATVMGGFSWHSARSSLEVAAQDRLQLAASARSDGVDLIAERLRADFLAIAANPQIVSNFPDLVENLDPSKPGYAALVQAFRAPQSLRERVAYDGLSTNSAYGRRHAKVQELARTLVAQPGYSDLIFIDETGRVVYTTTKGEDFSLSVGDTPLRSSGLNRLYEKLKGSDPTATMFEDFADYPMSAEPSAFIGKTVTKRANVAMGTSQAAERIGFVMLRVTPALFDQSLAKRNGLGDTGQIMAVGPDGRLRSNPPLNLEAKAGTALSRIGIDPTRLSDGASFAYDAQDGTHLAAAARVSVLGASWTIVAEQDRAEAVAAVQSLSRTLAFAGLIVLAVTAVLGLLAARAIVRPLGALTRALRALAARENLAEVPGSTRRDEIGDIARAVVTIRDVSLEDAAEQLKTTEATRLQEAKARRIMLQDLADQFERSVGGIVSNVSQAAQGLQASSVAMKAAVEGTSTRSNSVATAAHQTADNVNAVAAAAEQLGATVQEIGRQVERAAEMSAVAVHDTGQTEGTMKALASAAARIGDVVGMVSSIAGQTNLLALNATIEAARAGDAGRGFAIVAAEVKELASQTSRATEEISQQVVSIQAATDGASEAIRAIAVQIQAMNAVTTGISAAVEEQGATTQEIVRNMGQASAGTSGMTSDIAEVARVADQAGQAAASVLLASDQMSEQSSLLRSEVERFLANVRAA